ncbi:uncharacterized protein LOC126373213 [Pectinophora gossypiella]|uniref:uncharacterized protein LOC126373213 n=1 Tax=Pectinophora gossypiella TaxID=13191 RepID=UPI00214E0ABD|nr:uncharacterized protein LOC126373213 [Pectinophora gossypiella]
MGGVSIGSVPLFDHGHQDWSVYKGRFEQWCLANDITEANDTKGVKRRAILLSALNESTYKLVRDLCQPKDVTEQSYAAVTSLLDAHFQPKRCLIADRQHFYNAYQLPGEIVKDWAARLRNLSQFCKFKDLDEMLRDRFLIGMRMGPARDKLFAEDAGTLTLAKAVDIAESVECARDAARQSASTSVMEPSGGVHRVTVSVPNKKKKCDVCGYTNHTAKDCRFAGYTCKKCGARGHLQKMCTKSDKVKTHNYLETNMDVGDDVFTE